MTKTGKEDIKTMFKRIVVPIDGSKLSKKAAEIGCTFAKETKLDLIYLHINYIPATAIPPGEATYVPDLTQTLREQGESILKEIEGICEGEDITVETKMIEGVPAEEIINFSNKDDLVIMGCKGHSVFERILVGSVAERVLHHSEASVLIVR